MQLTILFCLSFMGLSENDVLAAKPNPCHTKSEKKEIKKTPPKTCNSCEVSKNAWTQKCVFKTAKQKIIDPTQIPLVHLKNNAYKKLVFEKESTRTDPLDAKMIHSHLIMYQKTVLLL